MTNTATRLITLIFLLQNQPNQKASELAEKLGVSLRTVHRYFAMLDEMGIPVYAERGPYGGFSLVRGYKIPPLIFSLEEAVAVYLGTSLVSEMWGALYRDAAQGAMAKLENILPNEQRGEIQWARRSLIATGLNRVESSLLFPMLDDLRKATHEHRQVSILYQGAAESTATKRRTDPYALVFRAGLWYLVGYCHLRTAPRTFRVDRIQKLTLLTQSFEMPDDFDVHQYLEHEFKHQPSIRARLQFKPEAAHIVKSNLILWESVTDNPDGSTVVILTSPDLPWLASVTLSFAHWVTVLEPPELRQMVQEWAQATAYQYQDSRIHERNKL
jgi:predicted DNA-binding transcriptional regulator YafY